MAVGRGIEFEKRSSVCAVTQSGRAESANAINTFSRLILIPVCAITFYVIVMLAIFFMRRRGWLPGGRPSYRSLGNAFLHLQTLTSPETQCVLEETEKKKREEDNEGGPDDPTRHHKHRLDSVER
jgi:hypothetical protein